MDVPTDQEEQPHASWLLTNNLPSHQGNPSTTPTSSAPKTDRLASRKAAAGQPPTCLLEPLPTRQTDPSALPFRLPSIASTYGPHPYTTTVDVLKARNKVQLAEQALSAFKAADYYLTRSLCFQVVDTPEGCQPVSGAIRARCHMLLAKMATFRDAIREHARIAMEIWRDVIERKSGEMSKFPVELARRELEEATMLYATAGW